MRAKLGSFDKNKLGEHAFLRIDEGARFSLEAALEALQPPP
jgi:hypothetical protein